jgi:hypothetical protein
MALSLQLVIADQLPGEHYVYHMCERLWKATFLPPCHHLLPGRFPR